MTDPTGRCPTCGATLALRHDDALDAWTCPAGHGLGVTLTEAYQRLAEDELATMWRLARHAARGGRPCPLCAAPMVTASVPGVDGARPVDVDVCLTDELLWFDAGELDRVPSDRRAAAPDATEQARIDEITETFGAGLQREWAAEDDEGIVNRVASRFPHHPLLDKVLRVGERPTV